MLLYLEENENLEESSSEMTIEPTNLGLHGFEGALKTINESDNQYFNLVQKMMKLEHKVIMSEDEELLDQGKSSFKANLSNIYKSILSKIEEIFKNFVAWVTKLVDVDKRLIEKIEKNNLGNVKLTMEGYRYSGLEKMGKNLVSACNNVQSAGFHKKVKDKNPVEVVSNMLKVSSCESNSELANEVKRFIFGSENKQSVDFKGSEILAFLKNTPSTISAAKGAKDALTRSISGIAKDLEDRSVNGNSIDKVKQACNCLVMAFGAYIEALKSKLSQARAAANKLASKKSDSSESVVKESVDLVGVLANF